MTISSHLTKDELTSQILLCVCVSRRDVRQTVRDSVRVQCGGVSCQSSSLHQPELHLDRSSTRHRLRQLHVSHLYNNYSSCVWEQQNLMAWGNLWTQLTRGRFFTSEWVLKGSSHCVCIKHAKLPETKHASVSDQQKGQFLLLRNAKQTKRPYQKLHTFRCHCFNSESRSLEWGEETAQVWMIMLPFMCYQNYYKYIYLGLGNEVIILIPELNSFKHAEREKFSPQLLYIYIAFIFTYCI